MRLKVFEFCKYILADRGACVRLLLAVCLLSVTLVFGLSCGTDFASSVVREYGYYFNLILLGGIFIYSGRIVCALYRKRRNEMYSMPEDWAQFSRGIVIGFIAVAAGATAVLYKAELDYKILMDDYLLAATAKEMHLTGEVAVAEFGRTIDGEFQVIQSFVDKRPWFYPFLVSLVFLAIS